VYFFIFGKTNRFSRPPLDVGSEIQVFSFYLPCLVFSHTMLISWNIFAIRSSIVCMICAYRELFEQFPQLQKIFIPPFPVVLGQNTAGFPLNGVPPPTLVGFALDKALKLIGFAFKTNFNCQSRQPESLFPIKEIRVRF